MLHVLVSIMVPILLVCLAKVMGFVSSKVLMTTDLVLLTWNLVKGFWSEKYVVISMHCFLGLLRQYLCHTNIVIYYLANTLVPLLLMLGIANVIIILLHIWEWIVVVVGRELCSLMDISLVVCIVNIKLCGCRFHIWHLKGDGFWFTIWIILRCTS